VARKRGGLRGNALHEVAVARNYPRHVVHDLKSGSIEAACKHALGNRHPDSVAESLSKRARRNLHARCDPSFGMSGRLTPPLPKRPQIVE
jgi:hypothetical protein